jgi:hypothetical protein
LVAVQEPDPALSVAVQSGVLPMLKATLPVGVPVEPDEESATVAE